MAFYAFVNASGYKIFSAIFATVSITFPCLRRLHAVTGHDFMETPAALVEGQD